MDFSWKKKNPTLQWLSRGTTAFIYPTIALVMEVHVYWYHNSPEPANVILKVPSEIQYMIYYYILLPDYPFFHETPRRKTES